MIPDQRCPIQDQITEPIVEARTLTSFSRCLKWLPRGAFHDPGVLGVSLWRARAPVYLRHGSLVRPTWGRADPHAWPARWHGRLHHSFLMLENCSFLPRNALNTNACGIHNPNWSIEFQIGVF